MKYSAAFIADVIQTFSRVDGRQISSDEAIEIIENFGRLVELSGRLSRKCGEPNCEKKISVEV